MLHILFYFVIKYTKLQRQVLTNNLKAAPMKTQTKFVKDLD